MNKSDRKEGLLKRLKNIESKSNNQLLALENINNPAIRGRDNGGYDDDDDDDDDDINNAYKKIIEDYKNNKTEYEEIKEQLNKTKMQLKYIKKIKKILKIFLILKVR